MSKVQFRDEIEQDNRALSHSVPTFESFVVSRAGELDHHWNYMQKLNKEWGCDFYEGVVAVERNSVYPRQLRSPNEVTSAWIKHRWKW